MKVKKCQDYLWFYKSLGAIVTRQRIAKGFTIAALAKIAGEQYRTIKNIEAGRPCSMHHLAWMEDHLSIRIEDIYNHHQGVKDHEQKEKGSILDLI